MEELVRIMSAAGAERLAGQYGVSAGVDATGVLAWSAKRTMARLYHADLAGLAWARYEKVVALASVPCVDGQWPGAGVEGRLDNGPEPNMREAYAFFQHGAAQMKRVRPPVRMGRGCDPTSEVLSRCPV